MKKKILWITLCLGLIGVVSSSVILAQNCPGEKCKDKSNPDDQYYCSGTTPPRCPTADYAEQCEFCTGGWWQESWSCNDADNGTVPGSLWKTLYSYDSPEGYKGSYIWSYFSCSKGGAIGYFGSIAEAQAAGYSNCSQTNVTECGCVGGTHADIPCNKCVHQRN